MADNDCNKDGIFGMSKCNFEPRYDAFPPENFDPTKLSVLTLGFDEDISDIIAALTKEIYVCDVCTGCGKVTKRPE